MARFGCTCGTVLQLSTGDEPHDLRLYPNSAIGQGLADISDEEIAAQQRYVSERTPNLPPHSATGALLDIIWGKLYDASRSVLICPDCKRLWLERVDENGPMNKYTSYLAE